MNQWNRNDERVHAFIDGQMDAIEKRLFLQEMANDARLQEQVCQFRGLKEYVRHAYEIEELPQMQDRRCRSGRRFRNAAIAATFLLAFGFTLGWFTHGAGESVARSTALAPGDSINDLEGALAYAEERVLLHIGRADTAKFDHVLDQAERLLRTYRAQNIRVEVIANAGGLDLVREDASPYSDRIREMMMRYDNLRFVACANAIERLEKNDGVKAVLVEDTDVAPSAVEHIIERIQKGWVYIKV